MKGYEYVQHEVTMLFQLVLNDFMLRTGQMPDDGKRGCQNNKIEVIRLINHYRKALSKLQVEEPDYKEELQDILDAIAAPDKRYVNLSKEEFIRRVHTALVQTRQSIITNFGEF